MNRRSFLVATGVGVGVALAGCSSSEPDPPDGLATADADEDQLPTPTLGAGPVPIDVYEDLGCLACHQFQELIFPAIEEFLIEPGTVTYRHYDFPIPARGQSFAMANAARAVQDETRSDDDSAGSFFAYKRAVFAAGEAEWGDDGLAALAEDVDVDPGVVATALEDDTYYPTLVADWRRGAENGVSGTPTVFVDGTEVEDPFDIEEIADLVEESL